MEQRNMDQIDDTFRKLKEEANKDVRKVYNEICDQLKRTSIGELGGEIAQLEARTLNNLMVSLMDSVKQAAIAEMERNGCKTYLTQAGWTEIQQVVGVPRIELCKVKVDVVRNGEKNAENASKWEKGIAQCESNKKKCMGVAASGAAITVITLITPGWNIPEALLVATGVVVTIVGSSGAVRNARQAEEIRSKFEQASKDSKKQSNKENLDVLLSKIINSQCDLNLQIYFEWLEKVRTALITECDKLVEM